MRTVDPHDDDFADLAPLRQTLAGARVVMLGEQDHGDGTSFLAKTRLIRFLHEKMGFDVLVFESSLYECDKTQQSLAAGEAAGKALRRCLFTIWTESREFEPLIEYVDAQRAAKHPLEIAGYDSQLSGTAADESLVADLHAQGFEDKRVEYVIKHLLDSSWEAGTEPVPSAAEQEAFANTIAQWRAAAKSAFWRQVLDSIREFAAEDWKTNVRDIRDNAAASAIRDRQMGKNFVWLARERYPKRKIIVWAATFHNARNVRTAETSDPKLRRLFAANRPAGETAKNALGDELYSIAITAYEGEWAKFWEKAPRPWPTPSHDSLEDLFARAGLTTAFVDFHKAPAWLHEPLMSQILRPGEARADWTRIVDGVLFVRRMERSHRIN